MEALEAWPEGRQRPSMLHVQTFFSGSDPAQPEALITGKAADCISHATQRRTRRFLKRKLRAKITLQSWRCSQTIPEGNSSSCREPVEQENNEKNDYSKGRINYDDKQAAMYPSVVTEPVPFASRVLYEWIRKEKITVNYWDQKRELQ